MRRSGHDAFLLAVAALLGVPAGAGAAEPPLTARFEPSRIGPADGYRLHLDRPYSGPLDYDLRWCPLELTGCTASSGRWVSSASGGVADIPGGQGFAKGVYLARFKPAGAPESEYSRFDALMVDDRPLVNPSLRPTLTRIALPAPGSSMVFEHRDEGSAVVGYGRIDVETGPPCELGGQTWRFTKTTEAAYFQPGSSTNLRWCVKEVTAADGRTWLVGAGGHGVGGTPLTALAERLLVTYPDRGHGATPKEPGLLGGFVPVAPGAVLPDFKTDPDLRGPHYTLLPPDRVVPLGSGFDPVTVVELSFGHPLDFSPADGDASINLWHAEIRPRVSGQGAITMRYVEHGITPVPGAPRSLWTQTGTTRSGPTGWSAPSGSGGARPSPRSAGGVACTTTRRGA